jgi:hypothetical protein
MTENQLKLDCDTCGRKTPQTRNGLASSTEQIEDFYGEDTAPLDIQWNYLFTQCDVCEDVSLYASNNFSFEEVRIYPQKKELSGIPKDIQMTYQEAKKVKNISPTAFAVMARRTLEAICIDQSAEGKNLKDKLDNLSSRGIIPATLARMSHVLRGFGNAGAHAGSEKVTIHEAHVMEDFLLAVIEYVYIAPAKLASIEKVKI